MPVVARFNEKFDELNEQPLDVNGRLISPVTTIGIGRKDIFTSLTSNAFLHHVVDQKTNEVIPASTYTKATYTIFDYDNDEKLILTLDDGIRVVDNAFLIMIDPHRIKFRGLFTHKFVVEESDNFIQYTFQRVLQVI